MWGGGGGISVELTLMLIYWILKLSFYWTGFIFANASKNESTRTQPKNYPIISVFYFKSFLVAHPDTNTREYALPMFSEKNYKCTDNVNTEIWSCLYIVQLSVYGTVDPLYSIVKT